MTKLKNETKNNLKNEAKGRVYAYDSFNLASQGSIYTWKVIEVSCRSLLCATNVIALR